MTIFKLGNSGGVPGPEQNICFVNAHIANKNGAVVDILSKYPFGHSHSQLQLQIYLEKMVLTKQIFHNRI